MFSIASINKVISFDSVFPPRVSLESSRCFATNSGIRAIRVGRSLLHQKVAAFVLFKHRRLPDMTSKILSCSIPFSVYTIAI